MPSVLATNEPTSILAVDPKMIPFGLIRKTSIVGSDSSEPLMFETSPVTTRFNTAALVGPVKSTVKPWSISKLFQFLMDRGAVSVTVWVLPFVVMFGSGAVGTGSGSASALIGSAREAATAVERRSRNLMLFEEIMTHTLLLAGYLPHR